MYFPNSTFQMVESALSPPYDGSEFQELFPELTGVEPEEMVDIESLADRAALFMQPDDVAIVENQSVMLSDQVSTHSLELESNSENGSVYECDVSEEEEAEDADQLLRYLGAQTSRKSKRQTQQRQRRQSSNDSGRFSDSSHDQDSTVHSQVKSPLPSLTTRKYTKTRNVPGQIATPSTSYTVIDESGARKSVRGPNRNAVMAKLNRERKKQLMGDLEEKVGLLDTENDALKKQNVRLRKKVNVLARELQYVKSVLANQSTLSGLLKNIKATGLEFHTSMPLQPSRAVSDIPLVSQKRKQQFDHDYCIEQNEGLRSRKFAKSESVASVEGESIDENLPNYASEVGLGGVCLHVSGDNVSLEFCSKCSAKAKLAGSRS
ncbi:uncharacterized protein LOC764243 isoform X1 [Strongylocentrotus purpuratus]|uniref:X-box-binding protein 1 n=2 Tax=Strongylocentrotus purpuratus TaxID=7668 RepID=A0A7M7PRC2_STRPU|nr:uncharacterized protein LOC764243 isoform X1 [Strongylocentrotus purpuratus]